MNEYYFTRYKYTTQVFYKSLKSPARVNVYNEFINVVIVGFFDYTDVYHIHKETIEQSKNRVIFLVTKGGYHTNDFYNIVMGSGRIQIYNNAKEGIFLKY